MGKEAKVSYFFLALGLIEYLKKMDKYKIKNEMKMLIFSSEEIKNKIGMKRKKPVSPEIIETPSEVDGLNDMSISFSEEEDPSSDDTISFNF